MILPDTTSSTRYTLYDKPLLQKALTAAGVTADIQNAQGDKNKFASIAQSMIGDGVKVLIIDSIDAASGAGVEKEAKAAGVKVIDYDRVNLGGSAGYYVSFDNEDVGKLQAQTLVDCLDAQKVKKPKIIMMDGGTDVDNNAVLFAKGAHEVLDPLEKAGKLNIAQEAVVKGWNVENAAPAFTQALTASGGNVQGVLAANDDIANAVIGVLKNQGLDRSRRAHRSGRRRRGSAEHPQGQAEHDDLQAGQARGRCRGPARDRADPGQGPVGGRADAERRSLTRRSPSHKIQALLLPSQVILQDNVKDVIDVRCAEGLRDLQGHREALLQVRRQLELLDPAVGEATRPLPDHWRVRP